MRVHPEFLERQKLPKGATREVWKRRFREINDWERYLSDNGFRIVKLFLNLSKEEQRRRLLRRIDLPDHNWKFSEADIAERGHWDDYQKAISATLSNTSTEWAPWHVIPADRKWFARTAAACVIVDALLEIDPRYPKVSKEQRRALQAVKRVPRGAGARGCRAGPERKDGGRPGPGWPRGARADLGAEGDAGDAPPAITTLGTNEMFPPFRVSSSISPSILPELYSTSFVTGFSLPPSYWHSRRHFGPGFDAFQFPFDREPFAEFAEFFHRRTGQFFFFGGVADGFEFVEVAFAFPRRRGSTAAGIVTSHELFCAFNATVDGPSFTELFEWNSMLQREAHEDRFFEPAAQAANESRTF